MKKVKKMAFGGIGRALKNAVKPADKPPVGGPMGSAMTGALARGLNKMNAGSAAASKNVSPQLKAMADTLKGKPSAPSGGGLSGALKNATAQTSKPGTPDFAKDYLDGIKKNGPGPNTTTTKDMTGSRNPTAGLGGLKGLGGIGAALGKKMGMKKGGEVKHSDVKMDKKVVKKAVGMHEKQLHGGKKSDMSKLKSGGMACAPKKMAKGGVTRADGIAKKGHTKGKTIAMKRGGSC